MIRLITLCLSAFAPGRKLESPPQHEVMESGIYEFMRTAQS
jgi:hypothetical protein